MTTQLSPERVGRITGSRIAGILGLNPYGTADDVLRDMVRQFHGAEPEFTGNIATDWGSDHEDDALTAYERMRGVIVYGGQELTVHPTHPFLAVTPDGFVDDHGLIEVKCPFRAGYGHIDERPDYAAQVRLQLECTGRQWCDFVIWRPSGISVSQVEHDPTWLPSIMPTLVEFMARYEATIADPELSAPHLAPLVDERNDTEWQLAALEYLELKAAADMATAALDEKKALLVKLADGKAAKGCGVQVVRAERKGSVDYSKIVKAELEGIDLEPYRKSSSVVYSVLRSAGAA